MQVSQVAAELKDVVPEMQSETSKQVSFLMRKQISRNIQQK